MKKKGFTLIELLVVVAIVFMMLSLLAVPFIIPWILEKNDVGSGSGNERPLFTTVTDGGVIFSKGKRSTVEIEPPFISSEEIRVTVLNPHQNASIFRGSLGVNFYFSWHPKETGFFDIEFEFSDGERREKSKIIIEVVDVK